MAICTKCGAVFPDLEANEHICEAADIPKENETIRFNGIKVNK